MVQKNKGFSDGSNFAICFRSIEGFVWYLLKDDELIASWRILMLTGIAVPPKAFLFFSGRKWAPCRFQKLVRRLAQPVGSEND